MKTLDLKWILRFVLLGWAGVTLCSCVLSEEIAAGDGVNDKKTAVLFSSGFVTTKVHGEMGNLWSEQDTVGVFMVAEGGSLAANTISGALNKPYRVRNFNVNKSDLLPAPDTLWYPIAGKVNFVLYYPYKKTLTLDSIYPVKLSDQSRPEAIDLMYAHNPTAYGADMKGSVEVVFEHQLTKLIFQVTRGSKITSLSGLSLDISNVAVETTFNLSSAKLADGGRGGQSKLSARIVSATTDAARAEAIVLPVTDLEDTEIEVFIKVDGSLYTAILPRPTNAATAALDAGYLYTYDIFLNKDGIALSGKLTPWNEGGTGTPQFAEVPYPTSPIEIAMSRKIPAGTFMMGRDPALDTNFPNGHTPPTNEDYHQVTLTKDFYISKYEITGAQYAAFLNANGIDASGRGSVTVGGALMTNVVFTTGHTGRFTYQNNAWAPKPNMENYPVTNVTWYGAKAFADWAGMQLPTEAQWEYACRATTNSLWYFGNDASVATDYGWFSPGAGMKAVGTKLPNAWGVYDMHGNVGEWCTDYYIAHLGTSPVTDPENLVPGTDRVWRGGHYGYDAYTARSSRRHCQPPDETNGFLNYQGFRVVFVP